MAKKILLADDSITIQKVITITLASEDYDLVIVGDGDSAVSKAREIRPDLVLADVAMPGRNGYEVCAAIKSDAALKNTPVLLLAGTFEPLNREEAAKAGADDSIVKPFESQELIDKVRDLIKKGGPRAVAPQTAQLRPVEEKKPAAGVDDIWEAGDFLGFTEEAEAKVDLKEAGAPDLDFLEGGVFDAAQPQKDKFFSQDHGFMDLEFKEDEAKPSSAPAPDFEIETFGREFSGFGALEPEKPREEKKAEDKKDAVPSFDTSSFEGFNDAAFEPPSFSFDEFKGPSPETGGTETFRAKGEETAPGARKGAFVEPDIIEMPQEVESLPEPVIEPQAQAPVAERRIEPPARPEISVDTVERGAEAKVSEVIEKVAARVEERITQVSAALEKAESQLNRAIDSVTSRAEENLRSGLSSAFQRADGQVAKMVEGVTQRAEQRVREEISATLNRLTPPRESVEDIIRKAAREVVEQVVWEVIPEMAENLIKAEIARFKEALARTK